MAPCSRTTSSTLEDLGVGELERVVGHVDLDRRVAVAEQRRQLLAQHLRGGVGDDQVERVVDGAAPVRPLVVVGHRPAQRLALELAHEGHDGGVAAAGGGDGAGAEVVGGAGTGLRRGLVEVHVAVDAAGQDEHAGGIQLLLAALERFAERGDASVPNADVGGEAVGGGHHGASPDNQIEAAHVSEPRCRACPSGMAGRLGPPAILILGARP